MIGIQNFAKLEESIVNGCRIYVYDPSNGGFTETDVSDFSVGVLDDMIQNCKLFIDEKMVGVESVSRLMHLMGMGANIFKSTGDESVGEGKYEIVKESTLKAMEFSYLSGIIQRGGVLFYIKNVNN